MIIKTITRSQSMLPVPRTAPSIGALSQGTPYYSHSRVSLQIRLDFHSASFAMDVMWLLQTHDMVSESAAARWVEASYWHVKREMDFTSLFLILMQRP